MWIHKSFQRNQIWYVNVCSHRYAEVPIDVIHLVYSEFQIKLACFFIYL